MERIEMWKSEEVKKRKPGLKERSQGQNMKKMKR
jgi:hypothetical protein